MTEMGPVASEDFEVAKCVRPGDGTGLSSSNVVMAEPRVELLLWR